MKGSARSALSAPGRECQLRHAPALAPQGDCYNFVRDLRAAARCEVQTPIARDRDKCPANRNITHRDDELHTYTPQCMCVKAAAVGAGFHCTQLHFNPARKPARSCDLPLRNTYMKMYTNHSAVAVASPVFLARMWHWSASHGMAVSTTTPIRQQENALPPESDKESHVYLMRLALLSAGCIMPLVFHCASEQQAWKCAAPNSMSGAAVYSTI